MNGVSNSAIDFIEEDSGGGSDSDANSDGSTEYYQPISAHDGDEDASDAENFDLNSDNVDAGPNFSRPLPNGYAHGVENGISSLDLSSSKDASGGSDSDTNSDGWTDDGDEDASDAENSDLNSDNVDAGPDFSRRLPNGYAHGVGNGISSLDLSSSSEEEEQEEERRREATDSAILRAFTEDESRRNAPLTAETATRVMEAMRGVSFSGLAPVWADQVAEDQWINQLRRLRRPQTHSPLNH